ncbi:major facilitator superfamily domain-containing protein [Triangularia verruculosa]|uniref:Major facilitator superfamily domain-containing protein n=1 Tax=Triangularia verruculosa TaxID=2587418 RepID=A0AAN7AX12_9PEZI|nr:major facilitator superfamily domain-containing protein [Triangularia verruculosa]
MYLGIQYAKKKYRQHRQQPPLSSCSHGSSSSANPIISPPRAVLPTEQQEEAKAQKSARRRYRLKIILGLFLPYTLQALDTTITASALPSIVSDFDQRSQLNWLITSFNLPSASFLPLWAQLVDIFGRHAALQWAILIIIVGSAICTGAPANQSTGWGVMLFGRGLQGVGAAGVNICVRTILADKVSLAEYAKNWSLFAVFAAVGFGVGPVIGGYLSKTKEGWRWCFGLNLPVGVVAMGVVWWVLRGELVGAVEGAGEEGREEGRLGRLRRRLGTIDYGGQILFLLGMGLLILGLTWAGAEYTWDSVAVIVPLVVGGMLTIGWVGHQWAMAPDGKLAKVFPRQRAMMPWELLAHKDIGLLLFINSTVGAAMYSVMYFMDIYFVEVMGHDSSDAGLALLYFLPGMGAGVYMAMFWINVWPRQTFPALFLGTATSAVAISVLPYACWTEKTSVIYGMMALAGFGVGINTNPGSLHGLAYFPQMTAAITCIVTFAVPFGGTIALTIMSTVFNNRSGTNHAEPKTGIFWGFISLIPLMWLSVLLTTCLGNVWVGKEGAHELIHGVWLWNLVRGRKPKRVRMASTGDEYGLDLIPLRKQGLGSPNGGQTLGNNRPGRPVNAETEAAYRGVELRTP